MMITIRTGTIDVIQFNMKQLTDNEREALNLVGAVVTFEAKQTGPSEEIGDPNPVKTISKVCTIVNPATGVVNCALTAADTNTVGKYSCAVEVQQAGNTFFNKYPFELEIWDL